MNRGVIQDFVNLSRNCLNGYFTSYFNDFFFFFNLKIINKKFIFVIELKSDQYDCLKYVVKKDDFLNHSTDTN